ncbi:MAG: AAC(3) family N-acetyltransferase [Chloroflexi bacterium]|nr:AAC(3) family N-acetyltransferase [Chloroflexota bacterium]
MLALSQEQMVNQLRALGLGAGQIVFVHSSLRSLGYVEGGAETVVDAFLEVLGAAGTLIVPTFTFAHGNADAPIFDPQQDRSEMGAISEAVRQRALARRSVHLLHSVAALGAQATEICAVQGASAWAADGPFWQLYEQNATLLLLGVPYLRCTWFHVIEQLVQVSYREWVAKDARVRTENGQIEALPTRIYRPKADFAGNDFNKFGRVLEEAGKVRIQAVGNAIACCFTVRDALALGVAHYRKDPRLFVKTSATYQALPDGVMTGALHSEKVVVAPTQMFHSG